MKITRLIALCAMTALIGVSALHAQTTGGTSVPAEFPPASFKAKQYVDSKGCIFIRAGIGGNVTWVPRVARTRKQICGYKPSLTASAAAAAPRKKPAPAAVQITLAPSAAAPTAAAPRAAAQTFTAPPVTTTVRVPTTARVVAKPPRKPAQAAAAVPVYINPPTTSARRSTTASTGPIAATGRSGASGTCPGASAFSQQFINNNSRYPVRCGPQKESPISVKSDGRSSSLAVPGSSAGQPYYVAGTTTTSNTRIVPLHVYENRQNTTDVQVADGFVAVWEDDRLNPHRAERTTAPERIRETVQAPTGYIPAWDDDRLNRSRGGGTATAEAATDQIWTRTLPRTLIVQPVPAATSTVLVSTYNSPSSVIRTSTRSAPAATQPVAQVTGKPKFIRVATYASDASARSTAKSLAGRGLPMRLGTVTRSGKAYRVVLAGPFTSPDQANAALVTVRNAGFSTARISK